MDHGLKGTRRQAQGGALAPPEFLDLPFQFFAEHYSSSESDTDTLSDSFQQSEIR